MPMHTHTGSGGQATPQGSLVPLHTDRAIVPSTHRSSVPDAPPVPGSSDHRLALDSANSAHLGDFEPLVAHGGATVAARSRSRSKWGFWRDQRRNAVVCLLLAAGMIAVLIPAVGVAKATVESTSGGSFGRYLGQMFGRILPLGGLPPTGPLLGWAEEESTTDGASSDAATDTESGTNAPAESDSAPATTPPDSPSRETQEEQDSTPVHPSTGDGNAAETGNPKPDAPPPSPPEETTSNASGTDAPPPGETDDPATESAPNGSPEETEKDIVGDSESTEPAEPPTTPSAPAGCYPIVSLELSESTRGAGYVHSEVGTLPDTLPSASLWHGEAPTVLLIHTHPYEGYGDGTAYYDPAVGPLGVTDSPSDPDGVVALGTRLARALRGHGLTVIQLRVAVTPGETADAINARTAALVRYYCRLYPDIGLLLDLRRSAEMTAEGGILRTSGSWRGETVAQMRLTVSGERPSAAMARDLKAALAIRARLWAMEPTLSRPVRVRDGDGLAGDAGLDAPDGTSDNVAGDASVPVVLTAEFGSAGNTFDEAAALVAPMAEAIGMLLLSETADP